MADNTTRFSDRVEDYIKYRPHYPDSIVQALEDAMVFDQSKIIADIGSGTGISSTPFLKAGYSVLGVEPNKEMREAAEQLLSTFPGFRSIDGSAEKTNLPDNSVDLVFSGQAFHWFDKEASKTEFNRILAQEGHIVLAWNERSMNSKFQQEYEQVLYDSIEEYKFVRHRNINESVIAQFFAPKAVNKISMQNWQVLDFAGLVGRLRSASYCPKSGEQYELIIKQMKSLFDRYKGADTVRFEYETKIYWC